MKTLYRIILTAFAVSLSNFSAFAQIIITENDSLKDFLTGKWYLIEQDSISNMDCDDYEGLGNIGNSKKIVFNENKKSYDTISCSFLLNDSIICKNIDFEISYIVPSWSSSFNKEWVFTGGGKIDSLALMTRFKILSRDKIYLKELCADGFDGYFGRIASPTDIKKNSVLSKNFGFYPNPATDFINIKSSENIIAIGIYSLNGQLVLSKKINEYEVNVGLAALKQGLYFLKVHTRHGAGVEKIIIKK